MVILLISLKKLDLDHDGVVGHDEFIAACLQVNVRTNRVFIFKKIAFSLTN